MRCATRIGLHQSGRAARVWGHGWRGTCIIRAVGAIHGIQVGSFDLATGASAGLQCTLTTASYFPDGDGGLCKTKLSLPAQPGRVSAPDASTPLRAPNEGNVYTLHIMGPTAFVDAVAEALADDVLVGIVGRHHVQPYNFGRCVKHECPTVRLSFDRLRSTEDSLRILHAPDATAARQQLLYRAIFNGEQL
ncbi:hypothetical protein LSCM1_07372 [Leishmania martiniquensis]|uniref:Uncharacterized protein n=1 Tax=Leishmania martiniquensis TaxID=1580590 RepID=A0A836H7I8_9TRYP|nr:hypothetical protein LSCM1_07372 [Leishmania martiniquensis]